MKVLVTGADGFLGREIVNCLLARGASVRALVESSSGHLLLPSHANVEVVIADIDTSAALQAACAGVDVVVHPASSVVGSNNEFEIRFVLGTQILLAAMAKNTCRRLVLESSLCVYDYTATDGYLNEQSQIYDRAAAEKRGGYTRAKWLQEDMARRFAETFGCALTVLRPGIVWGRGDARIPQVIRVGRRFYIVIGPKRRLPLTHVGNCADLFAIAATDERCRNETFNVVDEPGVCVGDHLRDYMRQTAQRGIVIPIPFAVANAIVVSAHFAVFRFMRKVPDVLVPDGFASRFKPMHFDTTKLRERLGWTPPISYLQCLRQTFGA